ncbi:MAG: metallophosphoesterase family protein [Candidatus Woesearchaeota archaeon]
MFVFDGVRFALTHYPEIALRVAEPKQLGVVCYGHTYLYKQEVVGVCLLLNPGSILRNNGPAQFVVYDTESKEVFVYALFLGD